MTDAQLKVIQSGVLPVGKTITMLGEETLRQKLIRLGFITPASSFYKMDKNDPKRVAYERKLILMGD